MLKIVHSYIYWIWAGVLLLANVLPLGVAVNNTGKSIGFRIDYLFHSIGCLILPLILLIGHRKSNRINSNRESIKRLIIFSFVYAGFLEIIQIFIPYRTFNLMDLVSNVVGVCIGVAFLFL